MQNALITAARQTYTNFQNSNSLTFCLSNAIHCMGQNIKSLAACVCVSMRVRARVLASPDSAELVYNSKRLEIETWYQWTTNRKWPMANRLVT